MSDLDANPGGLKSFPDLPPLTDEDILFVRALLDSSLRESRKRKRGGSFICLPDGSRIYLQKDERTKLTRIALKHSLLPPQLLALVDEVHSMVKVKPKLSDG